MITIIDFFLMSQGQCYMLNSVQRIVMMFETKIILVPVMFKVKDFPIMNFKIRFFSILSGISLFVIQLLVTYVIYLLKRKKNFE